MKSIQLLILAGIVCVGIAGCNQQTEVTLPEDPQPYQFTWDAPEVGLSRGFFVDAVSIQSERGLTADQIRLFEQRELKKVWVQPGHRYITFRLAQLDSRFEGKPIAQRPHFILTESGLTGLSWEFPDTAVTQEQLSRLATERDVARVNNGECPEAYPRMAVALERMSVSNGDAIIPRGTLAVVETTSDGSENVRLVDDIPNIDENVRFRMINSDWKIVNNDFCLNTFEYAIHYVASKFSEFDNRTRRFVYKRDYTKNMRSVDRSQLERGIERAVEETSTSAWRLGVGPTEVASGSDQQVSSEAIRELVLSELLTEYSGDRDEIREIYRHGDQVSTLRSFYETDDNFCVGPTWIYSQRSSGGSIRIDSCFLQEAGVPFQLNANGFEVLSWENYLTVRNLLLQETRGTIDNEAQTDFLMSRLSHYFQDGIDRDVLLSRISDSNGIQFGEVPRSSVVAYPDIDWSQTPLNTTNTTDRVLQVEALWPEELPSTRSEPKYESLEHDQEPSAPRRNH